MSKKQLKQITPGAIVKLTENGSPVEFVVAAHDYESALNGSGRTLLVRRRCYAVGSWGGSNASYSASTLDAALNETYKTRLDPDMLSLAGTTIRVVSGRKATQGTTAGEYTYTTLQRDVFALSLWELGGHPSDQSLPKEGTTLAIYTQLWDALDDSGSSVAYQWLRTRNISTTGSWSTVAYQAAQRYPVVAATLTGGGYRPALTLPETLYVLDDGQLVYDAAPVVSGTDSALGTFAATSPKVSYSVSDEDDDTVTVKILLDGVQLSSSTATVGKSYTFELTGNDWLSVLNGVHKLEIVADDGVADDTRTYTFVKNVTEMSVTFATPLKSAAQVTKAIETITGELPTGASVKVEVCNNGFDASPTWEDVTQRVLAAEKFTISNAKKTAAQWGYNLRVTVSRSGASGNCYINSIGGYFE